MNICDAGHKIHDRRIVDTIQGKFLIFDYEQYMGYSGYCTGQDDISRTLSLYGNWSMEIYNCIDKILCESGKGLFIDVGCHIGWFSAQAESAGLKVIGFDGDPENLELAKINVPNGEFTNMLFDENTKSTEIIYEAELIKIDIEGNEQYALIYFEKSFAAGTIKNAIIEISPVFNNSYPALVERMKKWNYEVLLVDGTKWDGKFNFNQTDFLFKLR